MVRRAVGSQVGGVVQYTYRPRPGRPRENYITRKRDEVGSAKIRRLVPIGPAGRQESTLQRRGHKLRTRAPTREQPIRHDPVISCMLAQHLSAGDRRAAGGPTVTRRVCTASACCLPIIHSHPAPPSPPPARAPPRSCRGAWAWRSGARRSARRVRARDRRSRTRSRSRSAWNGT